MDLVIVFQGKTESKHYPPKASLLPRRYAFVQSIQTSENYKFGSDNAPESHLAKDGLESHVQHLTYNR
jgi:hypothetical protein